MSYYVIAQAGLEFTMVAQAGLELMIFLEYTPKPDSHLKKKTVAQYKWHYLFIGENHRLCFPNFLSPTKSLLALTPLLFSGFCLP